MPRGRYPRKKDKKLVEEPAKNEPMYTDGFAPNPSIDGPSTMAVESHTPRYRRPVLIKTERYYDDGSVEHSQETFNTTRNN